VDHLLIVNHFYTVNMENVLKQFSWLVSLIIELRNRAMIVLITISAAEEVCAYLNSRAPSMENAQPCSLWITIVLLLFKLSHQMASLFVWSCVYLIYLLERDSLANLVCKSGYADSNGVCTDGLKSKLKGNLAMK
jgi:hypothetical protein